MQCRHTQIILLIILLLQYKTSWFRLQHSPVEMVLAVWSRVPADRQKVAPAFSSPPSADMSHVFYNKTTTINFTWKLFSFLTWSGYSTRIKCFFNVSAGRVYFLSNTPLASLAFRISLHWPLALALASTLATSNAALQALPVSASSSDLVPVESFLIIARKHKL